MIQRNPLGVVLVSPMDTREGPRPPREDIDIPAFHRLPLVANMVSRVGGVMDDFRERLNIPGNPLDRLATLSAPVISGSQHPLFGEIDGNAPQRNASSYV